MAGVDKFIRDTNKAKRYNTGNKGLDKFLEESNRAENANIRREVANVANQWVEEYTNRSQMAELENSVLTQTGGITPNFTTMGGLPKPKGPKTTFSTPLDNYRSQLSSTADFTTMSRNEPAVAPLYSMATLEESNRALQTFQPIDDFYREYMGGTNRNKRSAQMTEIEKQLREIMNSGSAVERELAKDYEALFQATHYTDAGSTAKTFVTGVANALQTYTPEMLGGLTAAVADPFRNEAFQERMRASQEAEIRAYVGDKMSPEELQREIDNISAPDRGEYTEGYKALDEYFAFHPDAFDALQAGKPVWTEDIKAQTGTDEGVLRSYLMSTSPEARQRSAIQTAVKEYGLNEQWATSVYNQGVQLGRQIPGMMLTMGAGSGTFVDAEIAGQSAYNAALAAGQNVGQAATAYEAAIAEAFKAAGGGGGGLLGTLMSGGTLGTATKSALKGNLATYLIGAMSASGAYSSNIREHDYGWQNYVNAVGKGFAEYFTEGLFGFSDMPSYEAMFVNPVGKAGNRVLMAMLGRILGGLEEGAEEVANVPIEALVDMATGYSSGGFERMLEDPAYFNNGGFTGVRALFEDGGLFDVNAMWESGVSGAIGGWLMGMAGAVMAIGQSVAEGEEIRSGIERINREAEQLPAQYRPQRLDPNTARREDVEAYEAQVLKAIDNYYRNVVVLHRDGQNIDVTGIDTTPAESTVQANTEANAAPVLHFGMENGELAVQSVTNDTIEDAMQAYGDQLSQDAKVLAAEAYRNYRDRLGQNAATARQFVNEFSQAYIYGKEGSTLEQAKQNLNTELLTDATMEAALKAGADSVAQAEQAEISTDIGEALQEYGKTLPQAMRTAIQQGYEGVKDLDAGDYVQDAMQAYNKGLSGQTLADIGTTATGMQTSELQSYYDAGVKAAATQRQAAVQTRAALKADQLKRGTTGHVSYITAEEAQRFGDIETVNVSKLNKKQKSSAKAIEMLAKDFGFNVVLYQSKVNDRGIRTADNGFYDNRTDTIYIDVEAGSNGEQALIRTMAHELTHHLENSAAEQYDALRDFLVGYYREGGTLEALVASEMDLAQRNGREISEQEAVHEVVANACEMMLSDTEAIKELVKRNRSLAQTIAARLSEYLKSIRRAIRGVEPGTAASQLLVSSKDALTKATKLWYDALEESTKVQDAVVNDPARPDISNTEAFTDSAVAIQSQVRPIYSDGTKAFQEFADSLSEEARKTFDMFYNFYQLSRINNTTNAQGKRVSKINISAPFLTAQEWNAKIQSDYKWKAAAVKLAESLPESVRRDMHFNKNGTITPTPLEIEFKMAKSLAQRLVDALPLEIIDSTYDLGGKTIKLYDQMSRQSVGGEAYRRAITGEVRKLYESGKLRQVSIGAMTKDRWGSLGFLATNGKTTASGDLTTLCPQMMYNRGCFYCYRRAAMESGVNNKLVAERVWYTGEILRIKDADIKALNENGGLRIQSFGDWMPHFSAQLADILYDADTRGLQVKIITKEPSMIQYVASLKEQGIGKSVYFNLSADYAFEAAPTMKNQNDNSDLNKTNPTRPFYRDDDNTLWWKRAMTVEEAAKYREKYNWVNTRIVATDISEFLRGLRDPTVDVVTGYHGHIRNWTRIDTETGVKKSVVEPLGDNGMPRFSYDENTKSWKLEYEGKTKTHKALAQAIIDNGLEWPYYYKTCCITGRCATCKGHCGLMAQEFGIKNFTNRDTESIAFWQENAIQLGTDPGDVIIPKVPEYPVGYNEIDNTEEVNWVQHSSRVTDKALLKDLQDEFAKGEYDPETNPDGGYITVYRTVQIIDGKMYAPMNAVDRDEEGKNKKLGFETRFGVFEQATESPEIAQRYMDSHPDAKYAKFDLDGVDNKTAGVAYNPYLHASNLVINDQFTAAYRRNLKVIECRVPVSEDGGAYHAQYAKNATGWADWKPGGVAGKLAKLKPEYTRRLFVSRYMLPVREVPAAEVAEMYKEYLDGTDLKIPWNVVTPELRRELEKAGVAIDYKDVKSGSRTLKFDDLFPNDIQHSSRANAALDAEYEEALAADDKDWMGMLVNQAAYNAGYTVGAYHGSPATDISVFNTRSAGERPEKLQLLFGTHFTRNRSFAELYAKKAKNSKGTSRMTTKSGKIYDVYLDLGKSLDLVTPQNYQDGSEIYNLYMDLPKAIQKKVPIHTYTDADVRNGMPSGQYVNTGDIERALQAMSPRAATEFLVDHGYNSVQYLAAYNTGTWDNNRFSKDPSIIMLDPELIKSAEPVTYDDDGDVVMPSDRFDRSRPDIQHSSRDTRYLELAQNPEGNREELQQMVDEAARKAGYNQKVYRGDSEPHNVFDTNRGAGNTQYGPGTYFTDAKGYAQEWAEERALGNNSKEGYVGEYYIQDSDFFDDRTKDTTTPQWKNVEEILKGYGVTERELRVTRNWGFTGIGRALQSVNMIDGGNFAAHDWKNATAINQILRDAGYKGIIGEFYDSTQWVIFDPAEAKSADPVTYDDSGNVIPLDERFQSNNPDIRHSSRDTRYLELAKDPTANEAQLQEMVDRAVENVMQDSKIRDEDGKLLRVFHGTDAQFTVFDPTKGRSTMDIQGSFFSPWDIDAGGYGENVRAFYLNIRNPAPEGVAYRALNQYKGQNNAGVKAREYLKQQGYDGVNNGDEEYIAFYPEQIKSADPVTYDDQGNVIPLSERFNTGDPDIRFSSRQQASSPELNKLNRRISSMEHQLEQMKHRLTWVKSDAYLAGAMEQGKRMAKDIRAAKEAGEAAVASAKAAGERTVASRDREIAELNQRIDRLNETLRETRSRRDEMISQLKSHYNEKLVSIRESQARQHYLERVQKRTVELMDWVTRPNKDHYIPEVLKAPVLNLLTSINLESKRSLAGGEETKADQRMAERLRALETVINNMAGDSVENGGAYDISPVLQDELRNIVSDAVAATSSGMTFTVNQMTAEQLHTLNNILRDVKHMVNRVNHLYTVNLYQGVDELGREEVEYLRSLGEKKTRGNAATRVGNFLNWDNTLPVFAFDRLGDAGKAIFGSLSSAQGKLAQTVHEIVNFAQETVKPKEVRAWRDEIHTITRNGKEIQVSATQLMELAAIANRLQGMGHMYGGGITFTDIDARGVDRGDVISEEDVANAIGQLSERQMEVVGKIQEFVTKYGGSLMNQISMARYGYRASTESHYWPLRSDKNHLATRISDLSGQNINRLLNASFTKPLTPNANNRIIIGDFIETFAAHMSDMAQYNAYALPILDVVRFMNYQERTDNEDGSFDVYSMKNALTDAFGKTGKNGISVAEQYIRGLLDDLNSQQMSERTTGFGEKALSNMKRAAVGANLRVGLLQPLSIARASLLINPRYLIQGLTTNLHNYRATRNEMLEHSGIARWKADGHFEINVSKDIDTQIAQDDSRLDKTLEKSMIAAEIGDSTTWVAIWRACKMDVRHSGQYEYGSQEFFDAVTRKFEDIVYRTQVVDSVLTKSELMRHKNAWDKVASSFMAEPTTTYNMVASAFQKLSDDARTMGKGAAWNANRGRILRTMGTYVLSAALVSIAEALSSLWRDDDEYEDFLDKVKREYPSAVMDNLNPLGLLPYVSQVNDLIKRFVHEFNPDVYGFEPYSGTFDWANDLIDAAGIVSDIANDKKTNYTTYGVIYKALSGLSSLSGVPASAAVREVVSLWNQAIGTTYPQYVVRTYDPGQEKRIQYAYQDGNLTMQEAQQYLVERAGMTEDEANKLVAKWRTNELKDSFSAGTADETVQQLVEDAGVSEDDAYWKVQEWEYESENDADFGRYNELKQAVNNGSASDFKTALQELTDHGVKKNDAISAVRGFIRDLYTGDLTNAEKTFADGRKISEDEAIQLMQTYGEKTEDEAFWDVRRWGFESTHGEDEKYEKYGDFYTAVETGKDLKKTIQFYMDHGVADSTLARQITERFKPIFVELCSSNKSAAASLKGYLLNAYDALGKNIPKWLES